MNQRQQPRCCAIVERCMLDDRYDSVILCMRECPPTTGPKIVSLCTAHRTLAEHADLDVLYKGIIVQVRDLK